MLAEAKFPVILSGGGVVMADGIEEVKALAEHLTAPVVNTYLHNDSFPASHPLCCGPLGYQGSKAAMRIIARADVVLALGTRLGPFGTLPQHGIDYWPKDAKIIQIDADHRMLGLVKKASLAIQGDAKLAAVELLKRVKARGARKPDKARLAEMQREKEAWIVELANWHSPNKKGQIGPRRALAQLAQGDAEERDGLHRHRQRVLGREQLPALRAAAVVPRRDELGQLRLRLSHGARRQGRASRTARRSPTSATAPGA